MATLAQSTNLQAKSAPAERSMPFISQTAMLAKRTLVTNFRDPAAIVPSLIISIFFLLVNSSTLSGAANFFLPGQSYLGFIVPLTIISSSLSGASIAGQSIVRDIERGYFDKLMLTPVSRAAIVLGPMIAGAMLLAIQTVLIIGLALLMGLQPNTGIVGVLSVLVFSVFIGVSFAGFTVGMALFTGSAAATGGASFLFFPLTFLTATYVPFSLRPDAQGHRLVLADGWRLVCLRHLRPAYPHPPPLTATPPPKTKRGAPCQRCAAFLVSVALSGSNHRCATPAQSAPTARRRHRAPSSRGGKFRVVARPHRPIAATPGQ